jgi:hypothetical protein
MASGRWNNAIVVAAVEQHPVVPEHLVERQRLAPERRQGIT